MSSSVHIDTLIPRLNECCPSLNAKAENGRVFLNLAGLDEQVRLSLLTQIVRNQDLLKVESGSCVSDAVVSTPFANINVQGLQLFNQSCEAATCGVKSAQKI